MPLATRVSQPTQQRGLHVWRVLVWLILLFSAFGCLEYLHHAHSVWDQLRALAPADADGAAVLHGMLRWDLGCLLAAFALIVICAGCVLRQAWARPSMRVAALLLGAWFVVAGYLQLNELHAIEANSATLLKQVQAQGVMAVEQTLATAHRQYLLALLFETIATILLLWLAWQLGRPSVRAQFRLRR
jgi:hypothetical protein